MPIREDILAPIAGDNPSGADLRYDTKLLIFDKIKEAFEKNWNVVVWSGVVNQTPPATTPAAAMSVTSMFGSPQPDPSPGADSS